MGRENTIIITGCGRSGTLYIQMVLQQLGIDVGHECWGKDGQVGFHAAVDLAGAKKGMPWRENTEKPHIVLHQVREPLATIASFQTAQDYTWDFVCKYAPIDREAPVVKRCMEYWYRWNLMAGRHADLRYQVEELPAMWPSICEILEIEEGTELPPQTSRMKHSRGHTTLTWNHLFEADEDTAGAIQDLAREYGYKA